MNCISSDKRSRIEIIRDHYVPKFGTDRLNHEILDWESTPTMSSSSGNFFRFFVNNFFFPKLVNYPDPFI